MRKDLFPYLLELSSPMGWRGLRLVGLKYLFTKRKKEKKRQQKKKGITNVDGRHL